MKYLIIISMLMSLSFCEECISKAGLEALGLTDVLETPVANEGDNKRCSFFEKVCIPPETIDDQIKASMKLFADGVKQQLGSLKKGNKFLSRGLFRLKGAFEKEKKKAKISEKLGTEDTALVESLFDKCTETECNLVDAEALENNKDCRKAIIQTMTKGLCLLVSDQGSANVTESSDGNIESLTINPSEMDLVFNACISYYIPLCEVTNVFGIFEKLAKDPTKHEGKAEKLNETCAKIKELKDCADTPDSCDSSIKMEFFKSFIAIGKEAVPGPPSEMIDKQEDNVTKSETEVDSIADDGTETTEGGSTEGGSTDNSGSTETTETTENTETATRLLASNIRMLSEASSTCSFEVSDSGFDLTKVESGVDVEEFSQSTNIFKFTVFAVLMTLTK